MNQFAFLSIIFLVPISAFAQKAEQGNVEVRLLAERIPKNLGKVVLANKETRSDPFDLPMNNLSAPQKPPGRVFSVWAMDRNESIAAVRLPEDGNSFVVLLLVDHQKGYRPVVMPMNRANFKGGDIYFYNNTNKTVLGVVGKAKFSLRPGRDTVVTPRGFGNKRYYHVMLGVKQAGGNKVIKSMKWPSSKMTRNYVFFYNDPVRKRVSYRAVDEFILPKKKEAVANP
ncbi:MAG: hypothetical protein KJO79_04100 [Verrucomicrobiae bacterium]|nr:hypothetical protein [Verrucomicrobiae bacterium]NNJ86339.1 hypothetical protein [Akkermansiaceae bacterium]